MRQDLRAHLIQVIFSILRSWDTGDVVGDFVAVPSDEWKDLLSRGKKADILLMYGKTWRNTYLNLMRDFVQAGGRLRFLLPLPDPREPALALMAKRIKQAPEDLASAVREAANDYSVIDPARVDVKFTRVYLTHAMYLFDTGGFVALYSYSADRAASPAIRLRGSLLAQCRAEFDELFIGATDARTALKTTSSSSI